MSTLADRGTGAEAQFFLHGGRDESRLCCTFCGNSTLIPHQPGAKVAAEAVHVCGLQCGCWSNGEHAASTPTDGPEDE